jgi:class 3 adenylate cyclase/tetratricopeptide (TPR) repeat protein
VPQERKVVTVLFADIVDSSATTRSYDAEVLRASLARTFTRTREILTAHGATVEKFIGDAVMAVFGVPVAHEDDPERAVRAALALRSEVSSSGGNREPRFTLRIGINSGEVVTGDGEGGEFLVTGEPVIVAARLEQSAEHGEILVGPLTREMTRGRVEYGPERVFETKGMGRIAAAAAIGLATASQEEATKSLGPFVGRDEEMRLLEEIHRRVAATGRAHLVTIFGDPGVGKSRLAKEFLARLDPALPFARATCLPYGPGITYWPLQELIRGEAQITPADLRDVARSKIEARVAGIAGVDAQEARAVARELAAIALADADSAMTELSSDERRRELALGMTRYLEARLGTTPGTIVLEDMHWAAEPFLALLDELLEHLRAPLLLLCLARPDLLERRPRWGSGRVNAMAISLESLTLRQTEDLARTLLDERAGDRVDEIVARTEGNPLFVEEYVHMLVDQGARAVVPPTLHGVIAARLDATTASVKLMLKEASVLGREFWLDALPSSTATRDVDEAERRGLISRSPRRGPSGSNSFIFRHGLIRDVAYASLSKAERTRVHDHFSRWLESASGERAQEYAEIVAYHAERAFDLASEIEPQSANELGRRAFRLLSRCAAAASGRGDFRAARVLNDRAVAVAEAVGLPPPDQAGSRALAAIINLRLDSDSAAVSELDRAIADARALGPSEELVRLLIWRASSVSIVDDIAESERLFGEAVAAARKTGDAALLAYAMWASSEPLGFAGKLDEEAKLLKDALAEMRAAGASLYEVGCLTEISLNALARGDPAEARDRAAEAVRIAEANGKRMDRWRASHAMARYLLASGDAPALPAAEESLAMAREIGGPGPLGYAAEVVSRARKEAGDLDGAMSILDETLAQVDAARMPSQVDIIARLEAIRTDVALARGDLETARRSASNAVRLAPKTRIAARATANLALAAVAEAEQRSSDAHRLIEETLTLLADTDLRELRGRAELVARRLERSQAV